MEIEKKIKLLREVFVIEKTTIKSMRKLLCEKQKQKIQ